MLQSQMHAHVQNAQKRIQSKEQHIDVLYIDMFARWLPSRVDPSTVKHKHITITVFNEMADNMFIFSYSHSLFHWGKQIKCIV